MDACADGHLHAVWGSAKQLQWCRRMTAIIIHKPVHGGGQHQKSDQHCRACHRFRAEPDVQKSFESRFLISSARSDNTDLFPNFADKIKAIPLQDEVHGHGIENSFLLGGNMENSFLLGGHMEISFLFGGYMENYCDDEFMTM